MPAYSFFPSRRRETFFSFPSHPKGLVVLNLIGIDVMPKMSGRLTQNHRDIIKHFVKYRASSQKGADYQKFTLQFNHRENET